VNGYALRLVRELRGRTIGSLARPSGVSTSFLARVERGEKQGVRQDVFDTITGELEVTDARALMAEPHGLCVIPAPRAGDNGAS
jgi:hypothetical protein